jgi:hypothetical protein
MRPRLAEGCRSLRCSRQKLEQKVETLRQPVECFAQEVPPWSLASSRHPLHGDLPNAFTSRPRLLRLVRPPAALIVGIVRPHLPYLHHSEIHRNVWSPGSVSPSASSAWPVTSAGHYPRRTGCDGCARSTCEGDEMQAPPAPRWITPGRLRPDWRNVWLWHAAVG